MNPWNAGKTRPTVSRVYQVILPGYTGPYFSYWLGHGWGFVCTTITAAERDRLNKTNWTYTDLEWRSVGDELIQICIDADSIEDRTA
jgi:hypothetical protein